MRTFEFKSLQRGFERSTRHLPHASRPYRLTASILLIASVLVGASAVTASAKIVHQAEGSIVVAGTGGATSESGFLMGLAVTADALYAGDYGLSTGASTVYKFEDGHYANLAITGSETPQGSFGLVSFGSFATAALAVDQSGGVNNGDLYVTDLSHDLVDKFDEAGQFECQITGAAVPSSKECDGAKGSETPAGGFEPTGLAVGATGELYVSDLAHKVIDEFNPAGEYLGAISGPSITAPTQLAVGQGGVLYIVNGGSLQQPGEDVVEYTAGTFTIVNSGDPASVAVDSADGYVYLQGNEGGNHDVIEQDAEGHALDKFGELPSVGTVGVSATTGKAYVGVDHGAYGEIEVFGAGVTLPTTTVEAPSSITDDSSTFIGSANPDTAHGGSAVTSCEFEYVTAAQFAEHPVNRYEGATTVPCSQPLPYASATGVSASVTGLDASTTYHYRLATANATHPQTSYSEEPAEEVFATTGPPVISEEATTGTTRTEATLTAKVDPNGYPTHYHFEYGETEAYGTSIPIPDTDMGSGTAAVAVEAAISGLKAGTKYDYRVVASNSLGIVPGANSTFETVPVAAIEDVHAVAGTTTATVTATANPIGESGTRCSLEYVSEAEFEESGYVHATTVACTPETINSASSGESVVVQLDGLTANTAYRFRFVVADPKYGIETKSEQVLTTFGVAALEGGLLDESGDPYVQAGGHPYELTTNIELGTAPYLGYRSPDGNPKDVSVHLPPGIVGNPSATARCTRYESERFSCSPAAQVGLITLTLGETSGEEQQIKTSPLYSLVPPKGVAAQFGARFNDFANAFINARVRTGEGYGISAESLNITTLANVTDVSVTMWGVPGEASHDTERYCRNPQGVGRAYEEPPCAEGSGGQPETPFLRTPTSCVGPLNATALVDSYQHPGEVQTKSAQISTGMTGCAKLRFTPKVEVTPESHDTSSPTGLEVHLHIPQEESATGLSEADLKDVSVTLPTGVTVNPSEAQGLVGCSEAQIEMHGPAPARCPEASKVGSVRLETPLFPHRVFDGGVYVAKQSENPFGSLLAIYVAIDEPDTGVVVKLAGDVTLNHETGQLTTTFTENPQLPFEDLTLKFFGGSRTALATPAACGIYTSDGLLEPWSHAPASGEGEGTPDAEALSRFVVEEGCGARGFSPTLAAGTTNNEAGAFSPFTLTVGRKDDEETLGTIAATMPQGVEGMLSNVSLCGEPQASVGDCSATSQIGHVTVRAGIGGDPVTLPEAGRREDPVYLTSGYGGGQFGLAIVVHPEAGPFNLEEDGHPVVVRAAVHVDPHTAQISIDSDPMPTILQGIPVDVQTVAVAVDRAGFIFNPTNCSQQSVGGTITSTSGASADVSSRFQAANCATLSFAPKLNASTQATTSKADGASLTVKLAPRAGQANIAKVDLEVPKQLPVRLTTLQQACSEEQFAANPAGCPAGSNIGVGTVVTPVLRVPLTGPAYLVSDGGAKFPDVEFVLQGEGVTIDLDGKTQIKNGVTYSHFEAVPDAPVSSFEATLPEGPHSIFAANIQASAKGLMCGQVLALPARLTGQNGMVSTQRIPIEVDGCPTSIVVKAKKLGSTGKVLTLAVEVPGAGTLMASGSGVKRAVASASGRARLTVVAALTKADARKVAAHKAVKIRVKLVFTAKSGKRQTKIVSETYMRRGRKS